MTGLTNLPDGAQAVAQAAGESRRMDRLRELRVMSDQVDDDDHGERGEALESAEVDRNPARMKGGD